MSAIYIALGQLKTWVIVFALLATQGQAGGTIVVVGLAVMDGRRNGGGYPHQA
jgi:hypothetical protein